MNRWKSLLVRALPAVTSVLTGLFCYGSFLHAVTPYRMGFGIHPLSDTALVVAVALAWMLWKSPRPGRASAEWAPRFAMLGLAIWGMCTPLLVSMSQFALGWATLEQAQSRRFILPFLIGAALMVAVPAACGVLCITSGPSSTRTRTGWAAGILLGAIVFPVWLLPSLSSLWMNLTLLALAVGLFALQQKFGLATAIDVKTPRMLPVVDQPWSWRGVSSLSCLLAALAGAGLCLSGSLGAQLVPRSLATDAAVWCTLLAATVLLARNPARSITRVLIPTHRPPFVIALTLAVWCAAMAAGFGLLVALSLKLTAGTSSLTLIQGGRILIRVLLALPGALCLGWMLNRPEPSEQISIKRRVIPVAAAIGYLLSFWSNWKPELLVTALAGTALIIALDRWLRARWTITPAWPSRLASGLTAAMVCCLLAWNANPKTVLTDRLLYSQHAFQLARQGTSLRQVAAVDDGRLLQEFASPQGRVSLWRHRGTQVVTRRNGVPLEFTSNQPTLSPRSVGDVLPTLLPLVMHPAPMNVLVLGAHESSLETCQLAPLASVTVWEGDEQLVAALRWRGEHEHGVWSDSFGPIKSLEAVSPEIAARSRPSQKYDVITLPALLPTELSTAALTQQSFYHALAQHLAAGGIFSQRLPFYDLGPGVVKETLAALRSEFPNVVLVESLPGELVCLASHSPVEVTEELPLRLEASHYRQLLGESGWDWSIAIGRGGLPADAVDKFLAGTFTADSRLPWQLPLEVARWGMKMEQTRNALEPHGSALWSWLGDSPIAGDITTRIEDQATAQKIQSENPDAPWAYRTALKDRLKERPRSVIEQVKFEGLKRVLHPDDVHRKAYLTALGAVATVEDAEPELITGLLNFTEPYDPLLSQFARYEVAHLMERQSDGDQQARLQALLHTVYFGPAGDRSVRNVASAIEVLCAPNSPVTGVDRWDHLNSLMHLMAQRWQLRLSQKATAFDAQDTSHCIAAVEAAMKVLDADAGLTGLSADDWQARREVIEETSLRPLQRHRLAISRTAPKLPTP